MRFRTRVTLLAATAVAVAIVLASLSAWFAARTELRNQVDGLLRNQASNVRDARFLNRVPDVGFRQRPFIDTQVDFQIVRSNGSVLRPTGQSLRLPVTNLEHEAALGHGSVRLRDVHVAGQHLRMMTVPTKQGVAIELARSLSEVDGALRGLGFVLTLVSAIGIALAIGVGLLVARGVIGPVERLTAAAEHVATTEDFSTFIDIDRTDELGRLAASFNAMLATVQRSQRQQQQLVMDASHEMRTPLTVLRTNIEQLARDIEMPSDERGRVLADLVDEVDDFSAMVGELVDLATDRTVAERVEVRLDRVVDQIVARLRRRAPGLTVNVTSSPCTVLGDPSSIERACANVLDNARKWSPPDGAIEVALVDGVLTVRDHGPGIDDDDLPHVFERFYRAASARSMPGSGLGLAIVDQVARTHDGTVTIARADGGGTVVALSLPVADGARF
jgi:two-component system, OmpR family, sensor histidine kinase MprB